MSTQRESVCCYDIEEIKSLIEDFHLEMHPSCITQHADFSNMGSCRATVLIVLICKAIDTTMEVLMFLLMKQVTNDIGNQL